MGFGDLFKKVVTAMILEEMDKKSVFEEDSDAEDVKVIDKVLRKVETMYLPDDFDDMTKEELEKWLEKLNLVRDDLNYNEPYAWMSDLFNRWISAMGEVEDRISSIEFYLDHCFDDEDEDAEEKEILFDDNVLEHYICEAERLNLEYNYDAIPTEDLRVLMMEMKRVLDDLYDHDVSVWHDLYDRWATVSSGLEKQIYKIRNCIQQRSV